MKMFIDPSNLNKQENYKLLIGSVLPRPIAFVTSLTTDGIVNGAPFSFFNVVGTEPPMISISCNRKPGGIMKDTAKNITQQEEFVVHIVDSENVSRINETSTDYPSHLSEIEAEGFTKVASTKVKVPGVKEAKIRMECKLYQWLPLGGKDGKPNTDLLIGEVVCFHIDDDLYYDGKINTEKLDPISRLAGTVYAEIGDSFSMPRKSYSEKMKPE
ncbi:flavin reductase family protein [Bacillus timonensis]|nr:flavin reductase family protein [Bacillus timonensis]